MRNAGGSADTPAAAPTQPLRTTWGTPAPCFRRRCRNNYGRPATALCTGKSETLPVSYSSTYISKWVKMKIKQGGRVKLALPILACVGLVWAGGPELDRAHKLYNLTEFQQSLEVLQAVSNKDAAVYALMGRAYYGQGEFKKATDTLDKALALEPGNSDYTLWLGRAYGRRAETSSMITAPGFANKARQFF